MLSPADPELDALLRLSERVGRDRSLVQGPGGNTSLKSGSTMAVKASGTWLAQAREKPILVPVRLGPLLDAVGRDDPDTETCLAFVDKDANPLGLRPSIETTMHAVLPQRVVVHVHCVETLARAVSQDARSGLSARLSGFDWAFVPYARPGRPLTRAILAAMRPGVSVLVLGNHGLVVAADTVADAGALLAEVSGRLRRPVRDLPPVDRAALAAAAAGSLYRPAADEATHALATDPARFLVAMEGSLYPDHVIFLGPAAIPLMPGEAPDAMAARAGRAQLPMLLVEGAGVLLHETATAGAEAMAGCLADVAGRIDPLKRIRFLSAAEEDALVNWDAEKYRQSLDARTS